MADPSSAKPDTTPSSSQRSRRPATRRQQAVSAGRDRSRDLIRDRIVRTRRRVKLVDLFTNLAYLAAAVLAYLLGMAWFDHWVMGLTTWMRGLALLILIAGVIAFAVRRLLPPLIQTVNPIFAAQTIEQADPSMKNGLVNLLLISRQRRSVRPVIYEGMQRQAASGLAKVPVEALVDRGPLIRAGYCLVALLAIAALYKVLSPKDPLQTAARIAAPWKSIARPARVEFVEIAPGDAEVYRGQILEVVARVTGLRDDEPVQLRFTTDDQQFVDRTIVFQPESGQRYRAELTVGAQGLQQSLVYRLIAGDSESAEYRVEVLDAPYIGVKALRYRYPAYTGLPEERSTQQTDIEALEGTQVWIEARANQPISSAYIELFATDTPSNADDVAGTSSTAKPVQTLPMKVDQKTASGRLTLRLRADRKMPRYSDYQLRFSTADGQRNAQPAKHRIRVVPDLPPEIEVLQPLQRELQVAENGRLEFELRAIDPDFAIRQIRVIGVVGGKERWRIPLLSRAQKPQPDRAADGSDQTTRRSGQVVQSWSFLPSEHQLEAGDTALIWAEADDNRHGVDGRPAPNSARTANYRIQVKQATPVSNEGNRDGRPESEGGEQPGQEQAGSKQAGGRQPGKGQPSDRANQNQQPPSDASQPDDAESSDAQQRNQAGSEPSGKQPAKETDPQQTDPQQGGAESGGATQPQAEQQRRPGPQDSSTGDAQSGEAQSGEAQSGEAQSGEAQSGDEQPETNGAAESDSEADSNNGSATDGETQPAGDGQGKDGQAEGSNKTGAGRGEGDMRKDDAATDESPAEGTSSDPAQSDPAQSDRTSAEDGRRGARRTGETPTGDDQPSRSSEGLSETTSDEPRRPVPSDGSNDGDAVERILRHRREQQRKRQSEAPSLADRQQQPDQARDETKAPDPSARDSRSDGENPKNKNRHKDQTDVGDSPERSVSSEGEPPSSQRGSRPKEAEDGPHDGSSSRVEPSDPSDAARERPAPESSDQEVRSDQNRKDQETPSADGLDPRADSGEGQGASSGKASEPPDQDQFESGQASEDGTGSSQRPGPRDPNRSDANTTPTQSPDGQSGEAAPRGPQDRQDPNLEYARKATDLALEHLENNADDPELLDRLGWTREEVDAFVRRWERLRQQTDAGQAVRQRGDDADWEQQLRSLGLKPPDARVRRRQLPSDRFGNLRQSSGDTAIPKEYRDQYRAFLKQAERRETP